MDTTIEPTVASTPDAAPAAPATSAPTSAPETAPSRPTSMHDAFARIEAKEQTDQPVAATVPPVAPIPGQPPQEKWPQILENARTKAAQEATAKFEQDYGWAKTIDRNTLGAWTQTAQRMSTDPIGFLSDFMQELQTHPTYGPQLRSQAGRMLATGNRDPEPQPDVQIVNEQGQVTGLTYSATALAERDAWNRRQITAAFQQELQPLKADRESAIAAQQAEETSRYVNGVADSIVTRIDRILDGDKALYEHVDALMAADPSLDAIDAALEVRSTHLAPLAEQRAVEKAQLINKQKAAGTTANGRGVSATPKRPTNRSELAAYLASLESA
jgi:hypothetical protein